MEKQRVESEKQMNDKMKRPRVESENPPRSIHSNIQRTASKYSHQESSLVWKQGTGPATSGSVLVILAQNGYTREAHKIIALSRTASLIGDGGLPELWNVMGTVRGREGITRLMAICITRGSLSPFRARELISSHHVDVKTRDDFGRTALDLAIGARYAGGDHMGENGDSWPDNPINIDLIRVLFEMNPGGLSEEDTPLKHASAHVLTALARDRNFMMYVKNVAQALMNMAKIDIHRHYLYHRLYDDRYELRRHQACIDAGAPSALISLTQEKIVKESGCISSYIAGAIMNMAQSDVGRKSCIDADAPSALMALSCEIAVKVNVDAMRNIVKALRYISQSDAGRKACLDAGAPDTSIDWSYVKSSAKNSLVWKQGTGPATSGSVLVILAQNGYTREAHMIIELSRTASLIGRKSDGGLPELWDVMGKIRGQCGRNVMRGKRPTSASGGITRLMAICITRGSLSPQRAQALIRDHNVDPTVRDDIGRTALNHALGSRYSYDPWPDNPINIDLIRVLLDMNSWGKQVFPGREYYEEFSYNLRIHRQHPLRNEPDLRRHDEIVSYLQANGLPLSFDEMRKLGADARKLNLADMTYLVQILKERNLVPALASGEVVLDMEILPTETLRDFQKEVKTMLALYENPLNERI